MLGLGLSLWQQQRPSGGAPTPSYSPEAIALFARMTTQPDDAQKTRINNFIVGWIATGKWATDDAIWLHAAHDSQAALLNLKPNPAYDCSPVNGPTFRAFGGFMPDGSSSYLSTGFNPATAVSPFHTQNNGSLWVRSNTDNTGAGSLAGFFDGTKGTTINPRNGTAAQIRLSCTFSISGTLDPVTAVGMTVANRRDALTSQVYRDGALRASLSAASITVANGIYRLGSISNSSFRNCEFSAGGIGAAFVDDAQEAACAAVLNAYLQSLRDSGVSIA